MFFFSQQQRVDRSGTACFVLTFGIRISLLAFLLPFTRYKGCRKSTCFDNSPRYVKFDQKLAPLLEVRNKTRKQKVVQVAVKTLAGHRLRLSGFVRPRKTEGTRKPKTS